MSIKPDLEQYSGRTLSRARAHLRDGAVGEAGSGVWHVAGTKAGVYTVHLIETAENAILTCTCPNGSHLGDRARCYHAAAVALVIRRGVRPGEFEER